MAIKQKTIKIGDKEKGNEKVIVINQFRALEAIEIRSQLVKKIKDLTADSSLNDSSSVLKAISSIMYEIPEDILMKLFKNCSAEGIGGLNDPSHFNDTFDNNLDGTFELTIEVLNFNGFFSLNFMKILKKKIPKLAPMIDQILEGLEGGLKIF